MAQPLTSELEATDPNPIDLSANRRLRRLRVGAWQVARDLPASFRYAAQGLGYSLLTQRNFRIHVCTGVLVFGLGLAQVMGVPYLFNPGVNLLSFLFSAGIGVVFGYFPARRAARMDPIDALRHE